jgi:hypothetical protein
MSCLSRMKVGNHIHIYEVSGYRDSNGKPRNTKHPVGKVDPETGREIFKPDFIPKLAQYGRTPPAQHHQTFSVRDPQTSTVRDYGAAYFLESIARRIGLKDALSSSRGQLSGEILTLAEYLIRGEDPLRLLRPLDRGNGNSGRPVVILPACIGSASRDKPRRPRRFFQALVGIPAGTRISCPGHHFDIIMVGTDRRCGMGVQPGR